MQQITATLPNESHQNARNMDGDKELIQQYTLVGFWRDDDRPAMNTIVQPVRVKWWMSRSRNATRVYCSIWVNVPQFHQAKRTPVTYFGGHGFAGGCGYDKKSAALAAAIDSAGIKLSQDIDGRGDSAVREAIRAIGDACGCNYPTEVI